MRIKREDIEKWQRVIERELDKKLIDMGLILKLRGLYDWLEKLKSDAE